MHKKNIVEAGKGLAEAEKVLIMLHGRGGTSRDILGMATHLHVKEFALVAPQATNQSWYPYSFIAPPEQNEPWLSSALSLLAELVADLNTKGFANENIYFTGFSQGACLSLEFTARNATKYGGIAAFSGGLIGDRIYSENYKGDFGQTPVFIGSSNPDFHIPVERVQESAAVLNTMNADVNAKIYDNMGHTINEDELKIVKELIFKV